MRSSTTKVALLFLIPAVFACVIPLSPRGREVIDADQAAVDGCYFLGLIEDGSGWSMLGSGMGGTNAKRGILERAGQRGATHVVFGQGSNAFGTGRAYDCNARALAGAEPAPLQPAPPY